MRYTKFRDLKLKHISLTFNEAIQDENKNQLDKWGVQHALLFEWLAWTVEEFGEFAKALNEFVYGRATKAPVLKEGIQTITLMLKTMEILENQDLAKTEEGSE